MRNAGLEEAQAGIKIVGTNINNLKYVDDTTLSAAWEAHLSICLYICIYTHTYFRFFSLIDYYKC